MRLKEKSLLLGTKTMTNLDSTLKTRDIILLLLLLLLSRVSHVRLCATP